MLNRRHFIGSLGVSAAATLEGAALHRVEEAVAWVEKSGAAPQQVAGDESFWFEIQQAFTVDRSLINLNNGGVSPSPAGVQQAMKRYLDYSNTAPAYTMWEVLEPQREGVRRGLAEAFGASPEEIAITRNASESLQICQLGMDLEEGDQVLTTNQDYGRMLNTWKQRQRRDGIRLKQISLPVPAQNPTEIVDMFAAAMTSRTRLIHMCHMINLTGQILPVREVVQMARARGVPVIVDGAHTFAHFDFVQSDLDCDFYGASLHKWLFAPHGTGLLYVRRDKIRDLWPLTAATPGQDEDIRKFEEIGTHPAANALAIAEALAFHQGIGPARKAARLRFLTRYWAERLLQNDSVKLQTSLKPEFSCGIANFRVQGLSSQELVKHLWRKHRILSSFIGHPDCRGIRVTPSVYTTLPELDRFCSAVESAISKGI